MEQFYIPYLCRKYNIDVVHSLHYSFPLIKTRAQRIVTIHDLTFFLFPKLHTFVKRYYFKWFTKIASSKSDLSLICVSESTLADLERLLPNYRSHNYVAPLAFGDIPEKVDDNSILEKFGIKGRYVSFVGTLEPRKNIEGLIKAYHLSRTKSDCKLVIVGKKGWFYDSIFKLVEDLSIKGRVVFTGFVTDEEKFAIIRNCEVFIYPSFYEGFGLPVLEAMSEGVPVITSNISSMPEVGGRAACYVNPNDIEDLAQKIDYVVSDQRLREIMGRNGVEQAKKFSWDFTADQTYSVYQKCQQ